jgi:hypothetical protein
MKTLILICMAFATASIQAQTSPPWDSAFIGTQGDNTGKPNDTVNMGSGNSMNGANSTNSGSMINSTSGSNHDRNGTNSKMNHGANSGGMHGTNPANSGTKMKNIDNSNGNPDLHKSNNSGKSGINNKDIHPKNYYVYKNGSIMHMNAGTSTKITKDVTLTNGSVISLNGKVKTKDGKEIKLSEGERVDMNGNVLPSKNKYSSITK